MSTNPYTNPNFAAPIADMENKVTPSNHLDQELNGSTNTNSTANLQAAKDSIVNSASTTMSAIQNHPATQQAKDTIVNGPVGQAVQNQSAITSSEFQDLKDARTTPAQPAATGQPLTHYHSLFYRLLSWKNPRATGIVFASLITLIFASRYLNILRYTLRALYTVLGITAAAEVAGKVTIGNGFATQLRPKQYYTIRKESLERFLDDIEQLINFAVIEFQRIVFVENIWVTVGAFLSSFISYFLIKWLPFWGLSLIGTSITFLGPLIYLQNKEFIDAHIDHAGNVIGAQAGQVRDLAAQHTTQATETVRSKAGEYTQKAQQLISDARGKATNGTAAHNGTTHDYPGVPKNTVTDFPSAPKNMAFDNLAAPPKHNVNEFPSAPTTEFTKVPESNTAF